MLLEKLDVLCSVEPMVGMLHICTEWKKVLMKGVIRLFKPWFAVLLNVMIKETENLIIISEFLSVSANLYLIMQLEVFSGAGTFCCWTLWMLRSEWGVNLCCAMEFDNMDVIWDIEEEYRSQRRNFW